MPNSEDLITGGIAILIMRKQESAVLLSTLIFYVSHFNYAMGINSALVAVNSCTCEGYDQVYECRVTGSGITVWRGTAFNCPATGNEIHLFHTISRFDTETTLTCNSGAIVGHSIRAENDTYISQLTVSVSAEMIGMNISCLHDILGAAENLIGSSRLTLSRDLPPPPSEIHLVEINSTHMTFNWSPVFSTCNAIRYLINSSSCGHCANITNSTTVTCRNNIGPGLLINDQTCTFAVQSVVCANIVGNESRRIQVALRTPSAPVINVISTYSHETKRLTALTTQVKLNDLEPFNISDGIDGSTSSYTVTYTDSIAGTACASATVPAASCVSGTCEHKLELPSSSCSDSTEISVQVAGTNRLGSGPLSVPISVSGVTNQFVDLSFDPASNIATCLFLNQPKSTNEKICSIAYGVPSETCTMFSHQSSKSSSDKVYLGFPEYNHLHDQSQEECCFVATASNGTHTVLVEGSMLTKGISVSTSKFKFTIGMLPFGAAMGALIMMIIVITITFIVITTTLVRSRKRLQVDLERLKAKTIEQPAIYEELEYVHMAMAPQPQKPASSPTNSIDIGQNTAYTSFSGFFNK